MKTEPIEQAIKRWRLAASKRWLRELMAKTDKTALDLLRISSLRAYVDVNDVG